MKCTDPVIVPFVTCQEGCTSDFLKLGALANRCVGKAQFGCQFSGCMDGATPGFECKDPAEKKYPVCANDKIVFKDVEVPALTDTKFFIDVNAPPLQVQYYFLVDTSASMAAHIHTVKKKIIDLTNMYKAMTGVQFSFALGEYKDPAYQMCGFRKLLDFTSNVDTLQKAVNNLKATGGTSGRGLLPSVARALIDPKWDSAGKTRKIVIVLGDAPGYEPTKHDIFTHGVPYPLDRADLGKYMKDRKFLYIGVSFGARGLNGPPTPWVVQANGFTNNIGQADALAAATTGTVTSPDVSLMDAVIQAKESFTRQYTMDTADCRLHNIDFNHSMSFPVSLKPGTTAAKIPISMVVTGNAPCLRPFTCRVTFREDGVDLMPFTMDFLNVKGCPLPGV